MNKTINFVIGFLKENRLIKKIKLYLSLENFWLNQILIKFDIEKLFFS